MSKVWKSNWAETQQHFRDWWNHTGLVFGSWGPGLVSEHWHEQVPEPPAPPTVEERHTDPEFVAPFTRWKMAHRAWPGDILPSAWPHVGTLPLAACLGAKPSYSMYNVWYKEVMHTLGDDYPPLKYDPEFPECRQLETIIRRSVEAAKGNYFIGMPAFLGGIDNLCEVRGTAETLMAIIEDPPGLHRRLREIQDAYYVAFDRFYDMIKLEDGSMCFGYFMLYGDGKVGLCQCDTAMMISPEMFGEFVMPYLREQCAFLDRSMFHIDGSDALQHLDMLLEIDDLDAIEYTPDPNVPDAADPRWFEYYRRILDAGKSLWVANLKKHQVLPVLDAIGGKGVYVQAWPLTEAEGVELAEKVEAYRG